jgi:DeoR/GlpR family transcriptional regulator of sugar metabolism
MCLPRNAATPSCEPSCPRERPPSPTSRPGGAAEPHFATKRRLNAPAKAAIAEAAAALVHDGMTVALTAGTTTWQVARRPQGGGMRELTFVTNSLNVVEAVTNRVMVAGARRVVVVADSSKLGQVSLATFASCDDVDELITDSDADQATLETAS